MKTFLCLLSLSWVTQTLGVVIRVPSGATNVVPSLSPFSWSFPNVTSLRYQEVYSALEFSSIGSGGGVITGMVFHIIEGFPGGTLPNIQINLSTTGQRPDGLSPIFAENVGGNDQIVVGTGPLGLQESTGPFGFGVLVQLSRPFFYDPAAGNLLMDIRNFQTPSGVFAPGLFAVVPQPGDSVSTVYAFDVGAASGTVNSYGLLTEFLVTPVPEPSTTFFAIFGALFALGRRLHSKNQEQRER